MQCLQGWWFEVEVEGEGEGEGEREEDGVGDGVEGRGWLGLYVQKSGLKKRRGMGSAVHRCAVCKGLRISRLLLLEFVASRMERCGA